MLQWSNRALAMAFMETKLGLFSTGVKRCLGGSYRVKNRTVNKAVSLIDKKSTNWPFPADEVMPEAVTPLPRTIADDKIRFQMRATFTHGSSIFYPHLKHHPADYKVALVVRTRLPC